MACGSSIEPLSCEENRAYPLGIPYVPRSTLQSFSVTHRTRFAYRSVIALLGIFFLLSALSSHAFESPKRINQYGHTAWRLEDGYFQSSPETIAQTTDGYLWFGTPTGTLKFDGVRFTKVFPPDGRAISARTVSLLGASDGSLWLGTGSGLARDYKGSLTVFPTPKGQIDDVIEDHNHRIWIVRARVSDRLGALCEVTGDSLLCHGEAEGITTRYGVALAEAADHTLWVAHSDTLSHWTGMKAATIHIPGLDPLRGLSGVRSILANDDGSVWIGMSSIGSGLGLQREVNGTFFPLRLQGFDSEQISAVALLHDSDDALWIGTQSDGIYRIKGELADHYRSVDGLSSDAVYCLFQDKEGNVWAATSSGIDRFRSLRVTSFSLRDGLGAGNPRSVLAAREGIVWIGNQGSLDQIRGNHVTSIQAKNGLPGENVTSLAQDRRGLLWVGFDNSLATYDGNKFSMISGAFGTSLGIIRSIVQDARVEDMYALVIKDSQEHLLRIRNNKVVDDTGMPAANQLVADPAGGVFVSTVGGQLGHWNGSRIELIFDNAIYKGSAATLVDSDGTIWRSSEKGLMGTRAGRFAVLDKTRGLPCSEVEAVIEDRFGSLWIHMPCGLVVVSRDDVRRFWSEPKYAVNVRVLSVFDGYFSGTSTFNPKMSQGPDGRIWSVNGQVAQVIDPPSLTLNNFQPPVHIEQVVADRTPYATSSVVKLPALTHNLQVDYTGLSFSAPQNIKFRYRLDGFEQAWQEAGNRRQAFYTNLQPGKYTFEVLASNSDGVWNKSGDSATIFIAPAFYQTNWFAILTLALCIALFYFIYLARLRIVTAQVQARMMERLSERERIARDLHDTFFQSIQGLLLKFNTGTSKLSQTDPARPIFVEALEESDKAMLEGRELVLDLRATTDTAEMPSLFAQAGEELQKIHAAVFSISVVGQARPLHPLTATELHRIGQEALYNAFKHSGAARIEMELEYASDTVKLRVRDDGKGIDEQVMEAGMREGHWGLPGMHERASKIGGHINIWSRKDNGTEIEVSVPAGNAYFVDNPSLLPGWMQRLIHKLLPFTGQPDA
jgi:signal transduction histidine kinase/ligand-binding sensor domain-containing protein